ncbi:MAG: hypothetical protein ACOYI5_00505 [Christensenellales bacterium]
MKTIIPVTKIGFHGETGDARSPESFPLPACMTSLAEALGVDFGTEIIHAHNREYLHRRGNREFLAASGMAFGLLWHDALCMSALDLTQIAPVGETVRRAFGWAGLACEMLHSADGVSGDMALEKVRASIDRGAPVLGFGLFDPPECALIAGYDEDALIGWSHFQGAANLPCEDNGMFRLTGWKKDWWAFVISGARVEKRRTLEEVFSTAREVMAMTRAEGYRAGQAAYDAWIELLGAGDVDEKTLEARFSYHHNILFSLAELRAWGGDFLSSHGAMRAGRAFKEIHDLCWAADAVAREGKWRTLQSAEGRQALIEIIERIRALDLEAAGALAVDA